MLHVRGIVLSNDAFPEYEIRAGEEQHARSQFRRLEVALQADAVRKLDRSTDADSGHG